LAGSSAAHLVAAEPTGAAQPPKTGTPTVAAVVVSMASPPAAAAAANASASASASAMSASASTAAPSSGSAGGIRARAPGGGSSHAASWCCMWLDCCRWRRSMAFCASDSVGSPSSRLSVEVTWL
jgi:hypothetical protein